MTVPLAEIKKLFIKIMAMDRQPHSILGRHSQEVADLLFIGEAPLKQTLQVANHVGGGGGLGDYWHPPLGVPLQKDLHAQKGGGCRRPPSQTRRCARCSSQTCDGKVRHAVHCVRDWICLFA